MAGLSGQGVRVLTALAEGRSFRRSGDGWAAGALRAPASLVSELAGASLVREGGDGLALTPAGRARAARKPTRPGRLFVERLLPEPVEGQTPSSSPRSRAGEGPIPAESHESHESHEGQKAPGLSAPPDRLRHGARVTRVAGTGHSSYARPARRSVTVNLMESPLGWLMARGLIDRRQFDAGERLRGDWTMAGLGPRVTMRWDASPVATGPRGPDAPLDPTLAGIAAKRRFDGAIEAAGKGLSDILWRVVCSGEGLEAAEAALGWPKRAGKLVLLMALDRVADYYGIA